MIDIIYGIRINSNFIGSQIFKLWLLGYASAPGFTDKSFKWEVTVECNKLVYFWISFIFELIFVYKFELNFGECI